MVMRTHRAFKKEKPNDKKEIETIIIDESSSDQDNESNVVTSELEKNKRKQLEVTPTNDESLQATADNSTQSISPLKLSKSNLFTKVVIKKETVHSYKVNMQDLISRLNEHITKVSKKVNRKDNCGYWTKHVIESLENLIQGKECVEENFSTGSSLNKSTLMDILYEPKLEDGVASKKINYLSVAHVASSEELNSVFPPIEQVEINLEISTEKTTININPEIIGTVRTTMQNINQKLMSEAEKSEGIIIGQVSLMGNGRHRHHAICFAATKDQVFYIDGQLSHAPIFSDLKSTYALKGKINNKYNDACFYFIHNKFQADLVYLTSNKNNI